MPCEGMRLTTGETAIVCSRGRAAQRRCGVCQGRATLLCDGAPPVGARRKTCDAPICQSCATHVGPDRDLCPRCVAKGAIVEGEQLQMTFDRF